MHAGQSVFSESLFKALRPVSSSGSCRRDSEPSISGRLVLSRSVCGTPEWCDKHPRDPSQQGGPPPHVEDLGLGLRRGRQASPCPLLEDKLGGAWQFLLKTNRQQWASATLIQKSSGKLSFTPPPPPKELEYLLRATSRDHLWLPGGGFPPGHGLQGPGPDPGRKPLRPRLDSCPHWP